MKSTNKKILVFVDWYLPGYKAGGPIKSCVGLVDRLSNNYQIKIITGNTDLKDTIPYPNVVSDSWNTLQKGTDVFYCSSSYVGFSNFKKIILEEQPDIIYLNSMYSPKFTLLPLIVAGNLKLSQKVVVAPRGMLSAGALALKSFKKQLFLSLSKLTGLFSKVTFHASSEIEVDEIHKVFGKEVKVFHAMNLTPIADIPVTERIKISGAVKLAYLGRISEVKNLLQCLKTIKATDSRFNFEFDIYGPAEDKMYLEQCNVELQHMPGNIKVSFKGGVENSQINSLLSNYHFLFLLSMNENFGHAIVEGFTAGCPVIISDCTPWRNLTEKKCGWDLNLSDNKRIVQVLNTVAEMNQEKYNEWSQAAYQFAAAVHENKKAVNDHIKMFDSIKS